MLSISRGISNVLTKFALHTARTNTPSYSAFHIAGALQCAQSNAAAATEEEQLKNTADDLKRLKNDRSKVIPVETSIKYLKSAAYKETYGDQFVWEQYRRNHKGLYAPKKTRKTCIRKGTISTGNPCPICRDEYLVLDHRNIELLRQFISPQTGKVYSFAKTGLCQKKHFELLVAVQRAIDYGLLTFDVPFRDYDYSEYYGSDPSAVRKALA